MTEKSDKSRIEDLEANLSNLAEALTVALAKIQVQTFALEALARTHPRPLEAAKSFRASVDDLLVERDDFPARPVVDEATLTEANAFLEALGQLGAPPSR